MFFSLPISFPIYRFIHLSIDWIALLRATLGPHSDVEFFARPRATPRITVADSGSHAPHATCPCDATFPSDAAFFLRRRIPPYAALPNHVTFPWRDATLAPLQQMPREVLSSNEASSRAWPPWRVTHALARCSETRRSQTLRLVPRRALPLPPHPSCGLLRKPPCKLLPPNARTRAERNGRLQPLVFVDSHFSTLSCPVSARPFLKHVL